MDAKREWTSEDEWFMRMALDEAAKARDEGNSPTGAVIVRNGEVVERGHNEVYTTFDVTAHAETVALRRLTINRKQLNPGFQAKSGPFADCTLYVTTEPCPMCLWSTCITGISRLVVGARHADVGPYGAYTMEKLIAMTARTIDVVTGVLAADCVATYRSSPRYRPGPR